MMRDAGRGETQRCPTRSDPEGPVVMAFATWRTLRFRSGGIDGSSRVIEGPACRCYRCDPDVSPAATSPASQVSQLHASLKPAHRPYLKPNPDIRPRSRAHLTPALFRRRPMIQLTR